MSFVGMKTTTAAVLVACAVAVFRRRENGRFFGRRIADDTVKNAITVFLMYISLFLLGGANILQEILTIKSDDVMGRAKAYEAIVKGDNLPRPGVPEAMNVLLHELRGLALSVKLE